jgi:uncharacterized CHY-type Zn-finger protein
MDTKMDIKIEFPCKVCNKYYSSYKSLWNHNKKFHILLNNNCSIEVQKSSIDVQKSSIDVQKSSIHKSLVCEYCNKVFKNRSTKSMHKKLCNKIDELEEKNNKINELEKTINELKNQVAIIIKEKGKIHHKTLQKINNQLNNNGKITNNINNINNTYVKFGDIDYQKVLNDKQIKHILNKQYLSLEESIRQIHFNEELPEYSNIFITNMKDDLGYVFDGKQFISVRKNEMLNELIDTHVKEINLSLEKNKNKLNEKYVNRLEKFLDMLNDDDTKFTDQDNQRIYPSYKAYKINSIKLLIYNESDKKKLDTLNTMELEEKLCEIDTENDI